MNQESESVIQETQTSKSTGKRVHRSTRNRPVLVTANDSASSDEQAQLEAEQPPVPVAVEEKSVEPPARRGPRFFANIGKSEAPTEQATTNPQSARLARALRGKTPSVKEEPTPRKTQAASPAKAGQAVTPPRQSGFKMRYIWGMITYLLAADFLGVGITNFMTANHLDSTLFTAGPVVARTSTIIFLVILVLILIVMARFDFLPRSFGAAFGAGSAARGTSAAKPRETPTFETRTPPPTMKQGVQGEHDDLYKEYRENQRYFQKRDRKR